YLRNFLEPFVKFIHELEGDVPLLSAAFLKLRQLETTIRNNDYVPTTVITESIRLVEQRWNDFLYNPATMAAYKLDPRYCGEILDPNKWDAPIERELIRLAGPENEDQVLEELSEYVGKTGGFSANYLWALKLLSIPAILASFERNWSSFNFAHSKLRNRLHNPLKELKNKGYLIEDNVVNLELNETNSVEENNIDDSLSDSSLYIDIIDYIDEIDDMDINENIDNLDSIDNISNIDNMDNMDSINDMGNDEQME
ncbi:24397_t:CDS:2, partial [Gigaspora margarita]